MRMCVGKSPHWAVGTIVIGFAVSLAECRSDNAARMTAKAAANMDIESLSVALKSPDKTQRCYAANAIVRLRHDKAREMYVELLKTFDCGWKIPTEAAFRLSEIGFRDELPAVRQLLKSEDDRHKVSAALVLADAGDFDALPLVAPLVNTLATEQGKPWLDWAVCRLQRQSTCVKPKTMVPAEDAGSD